MATKNKKLLIARLENYLSKLKSGEKVNARDLKSVLNKSELEAIDINWQGVKVERDIIKEMHEDLSSYTKMLHTADKIFGVSENRSTLPAKQRRELEEKSQKHYEIALEHLQEIFARDFKVQIGLDRPVSFEAGLAPKASSADVPRYRFARAHHAEKPEWATIKSIRIDALEEKLHRIRQIAGDNVEDEIEPEIEDADRLEKATKLRALIKKYE